jgi:hypothetical protein
MPTASTLGYTDGINNLCANIPSNIVTQGKTPFQSYWGPVNKNMDHVSFDADLANYVFNEIETYILPGKREFTICDTAHYTVNFPTNATTTAVTWTCSNNLQIVSGQGTKTIVVEPLTPGAGWVKAEPTLLAHGKNHKKELKQYDITITDPNAATIAPANITSNQTWNTPYYVNNTLTISNGATLTVKSNVYIKQGKKIIVNSGSKLIIDGCTFTPTCENEMWEGIVVMGNSGPLNPNTQGYVQIINNGVIQNAETGITVQSGGMISATGARFTNNTIHVKFEPLGAGQTGVSGAFTNALLTLNNNYIGNPTNFDAYIKKENNGAILLSGSFTSPVTANITNGSVAV